MASYYYRDSLKEFIDTLKEKIEGEEKLLKFSITRVVGKEEEKKENEKSAM